MLNNWVDIFQRFSFYLIFALTLFSGLSFAQNIDEQMKQAGAFYRNGEFDKAIKIYEDLRSDGYEGYISIFQSWRIHITELASLVTQYLTMNEH